MNIVRTYEWNILSYENAVNTPVPAVSKVTAIPVRRIVNPIPRNYGWFEITVNVIKEFVWCLSWTQCCCRTSQHWTNICNQIDNPLLKWIGNRLRTSSLLQAECKSGRSPFGMHRTVVHILLLFEDGRRLKKFGDLNRVSETSNGVSDSLDGIVFRIISVKYPKTRTYPWFRFSPG